MAAYSFSSLRDMLKPPPPSENSKLMESLFSQPMPKSTTQVPHEDPYVTEMFGELYFRESSSSTLHFLFPPTSSTSSPPPSSPPPPPPPPPSFPLPNHVPQNNPEKEKMAGKQKVVKNGCIYNKGNKEKLFPPPISCLKSAKVGKTFVYSRFDENSRRFVREEIKIPPQGLLRASRDEGGRLKLNFAHEEEEEMAVEEEEEEEEEEAQEANGEKETSDEEDSGFVYVRV